MDPAALPRLLALIGSAPDLQREFIALASEHMSQGVLEARLVRFAEDSKVLWARKARGPFPYDAATFLQWMRQRRVIGCCRGDRNR